MSIRHRVASQDIKAFTKYFQAARASHRSNLSPDDDSQGAFNEWLFMSPKEKKWFYDLDSTVTGGVPKMRFLHFMNWNIDKYPNIPAPDIAKKLAPIYKGLSREEKMHYGSLTLKDYHNYKANDVINKRQELKSIYQDSKELLLLEMILSTKPYKPLNSYQWFTRSINNCLSTATLNKWKAITDKEREKFIRRFRLDELRYTYETQIWRTKFLYLDLNKSELDLRTMLECRLAMDDIRMVAKEYTNLNENIFFYYLSYIIKERFLSEGEKSIHDTLEEATDLWNNLECTKREKYVADYVNGIESQRARLRRITTKYPEFTEKMILLEDLIRKSQFLKNLKIKLKLVDNKRDASEDARIRLIEQIY